jgi:two-component system response regulator
MSIGLQSDNVHVLLVEDNPGDVQLLQLAFSEANLDCDLTVIPDGAQALQFLHEFDPGSQRLPDLTILDLNVPKNDGVEILEAMRASTTFATVPVVILTSSSSPREFARLEGLGVSRHLTKPAELEAFLDIGFTIKRILQDHC